MHRILIDKKVLDEFRTIAQQSVKDQIEYCGYCIFDISDDNILIISDINIKRAEEDHCNSGDFPITWHTHPILHDNGIVLPSQADLLGSVYDNFRNKSGYGDGSTNPVFIFDILVSYGGLLIYGADDTWRIYYNKRPIKPIGSKDNKKVNDDIERLAGYIWHNPSLFNFPFNRRVSLQTWERTFDGKKLPAKSKTIINNFINIAKQNGITMEYFSWYAILNADKIAFTWNI